MRQARRIPANVRVPSAEDAMLLSVQVSKPEVNPIDKLVRDCGRGVYDGQEVPGKDFNQDCRFL